MKIFFVLVAFIQLLAIVTSLRKHKPVSITLNAGKEIPISGFLIDNSKSYLFKNEMEYQLNKMKTVSKDNSDSISAIKSSLTDISKAVNGLLKAAAKQPNYGYIGCYKDDNNRHLKHKQSNIGNSITLAKCRELCKGYKYTGLQDTMFLWKCFKNQMYPRVQESDCNMNCAGELTRKCGGPMRNSIYLVKP